MIKEKGGIPIEYTVVIILAIFGFFIILLFLPKLGFGGESDKQICYNSIVLSSGSKGIVGSINCKTNYLCISGGGKCEDIKPSATVKVNSNNKEEIIKAIADEMADCWWMFGQGELDYTRGGFTGNFACAVCSIVKFDEKIQGRYDGITYKEIIDSLDKPMNGESYLTYLYDVSDVDLLLDRWPIIKEYYDSKSISLKDEYVIMTGEVKVGALEKIFVIPYKRIAGIDVRERVYLLVNFLEVDEASKLIECDEYITKP